MPQTLFEKIIAGEITSVKLYEDDSCIAIMDAFPGVKGQSLVIPKSPIDYIFNLDEETYSHIFLIAKKIARATDKALSPLRTCLIVEGFEVPHAHIRLHPAYEEKLPVENGEKTDQETLQSIADEIKKYLR
jgi:histidine triad (HIT) family protein